MIAKQIFQYFFSKAVPGIINFSAIAIYTRLLSPSDYGIYSIALITATFLALVCFQWVQLSLLRFYADNVHQEDKFLRTIVYCFSVSALPLVAIAPAIYIFIPSLRSWPVLAFVVVLAVAQAWFDLMAEIARVKLEPLRYGALAFTRSVLSLGAGGGIAMMGGAYYGPLTGLVLGSCIAALVFGSLHLRGRMNILGGTRLDAASYLHYGLPLTLTFALAMVIAGTDRLMIGSLLSEAEAGSYSAGFDFIWQLITLAMVVINLAVYPLTLNAYAKQGDAGALVQLARNGPLLLAFSLPLACALGILAPQWSELVLGSAFRDVARTIAPWIAAAGLLAGMRAYHFDLAFQIKARTKYQVLIVGLTALLNIGLNFWWISLYGVLGSAYATFVAYMFSFFLSAYLGRGLLRIPMLNKDSLLVLLASALFSLLLWSAGKLSGYLFWGAALSSGIVYILVLVGMNYMNSRNFLLKRLEHAKDN